jgi:hypothetical protein
VQHCLVGSEMCIRDSVSVVFGPTVNLSDIAEKRVKRKSIQLVKNPKSIRN